MTVPRSEGTPQDDAMAQESPQHDGDHDVEEGDTSREGPTASDNVNADRVRVSVNDPPAKDGLTKSFTKDGLTKSFTKSELAKSVTKDDLIKAKEMERAGRNSLKTAFLDESGQTMPSSTFLSEANVMESKPNEVRSDLTASTNERLLSFFREDGVQPMPMPSLSRHHNRRNYPQPDPEPGAYHSGDGSRLGASNTHSSAPLFGSFAGSLVVARVIEETSLPFAELRESFNRGRREPEGNAQQKNTTVVGCCVICCVLIVSIVLVVVLVGMKKANGSDLQYTSLSPSSSPSLAPTSYESYLLSFLPEYTVDAIQQPESAQAKAFQWILEDMEYNPLLSPQRIVQRFSLASLFFSTKGEGWTNNNQWMNHTVHECDWHNGKDFALKEFVGKIFFQANYMTEIFPEDEPQPTRCDETSGLFQHLWLDRNNLEGPLPPELYLLTSLQTLSLGVYNKLSGTISSHVGQLTQLKGLSFDNMVGAGTIPSQIGLLSNLRGLVLAANEHTGTVPRELERLTNVQTLLLMGPTNRLTGKIPDVRAFPKLKWFLTQGGNDLTGTIPSQIGLIDTLEWYVVGENELDGTIPTQVGTMANIKVFSTYYNQLEGNLPTQLGLMTSSTLLAFQGNLLSGTVPSQFGLLTNLSTKLNLHDNPTLTGTIPTQLGLLSNLYRLDFANTDLTGPIPSQFGMLESLGEIRMAGNSLSGTIPEALGSLQQSLYSFEVQNNPLLSGTIPALLCNINGTCIKHRLRDDCLDSITLDFDCSGMLCGCWCPCIASESNSSTRYRW